MTSFLPIETSPTGTDVPGGALRTEGNHDRMNLVLAPCVRESPPVPTFLQVLSRVTGGTVATAQAGVPSVNGPAPRARRFPAGGPEVSRPIFPTASAM